MCFCEAALVRKVGKEPKGDRAEPLARVVVAHARRLGGEEAPAPRVGGEELAQVHAAPALGMLRELWPGRAIEGRAGIHFPSL